MYTCHHIFTEFQNIFYLLIDYFLLAYIKLQKEMDTWFLLASTRTTLDNLDCTSLVLFLIPTYKSNLLANQMSEMCIINRYRKDENGGNQIETYMLQWETCLINYIFYFIKSNVNEFWTGPSFEHVVPNAKQLRDMTSNKLF